MHLKVPREAKNLHRTNEGRTRVFNITMGDLYVKTNGHSVLSGTFKTRGVIFYNNFLIRCISDEGDV